MKKRKKTKYVYEGQYVVKVDVEVIEDETSWTPYLSLDDACKLDDARDAIRRGDLTVAAQYGKIYELCPIA